MLSALSNLCHTVEPSGRGAALETRMAVPALVGIMLTAAAVRFTVLAQLGSHPSLQPVGVLDDAVYVDLARRVAAGDWLLRPDSYYLAPLYTYFLGLVFALTGNSIAAARVVQVLLGTVGVGLLAVTASRWFGRRAGLVAGILAALTGQLVFHEILILQASLDAFLAGVALYAVTTALQRPCTSRLIAAGVALGALALNRPNALPCIAVLAVVWWLLHRSRRALLEAAAVILGAVVAIAPATIRNGIVSGEWVLITSHGGVNFYIGNGPGADGTWRKVEGIEPSIQGQKEDVKRVASTALGRPVGAAEASTYFYGLATEWIRANPVAWLRLMAWKAVLVLHAGDIALNHSYTYFSRDESSLLSVLPSGPWLIIPLGIFGLAGGVVYRPATKAYLAWLSLAAAYTASLALFFVASRYRLPLLLPLLIGSGAAIDHVLSQACGPGVQRRALMVSAATLGVLFVAANWPLDVDDGRAQQREEVIIRLIDNGQFEMAEQKLEAIPRETISPGALFYRVGLALKEKNEPDRAKRWLLRALAETPAGDGVQVGSISFDLGELCLAGASPREAIGYFDVARSSGVRIVTSSYHLATAYGSLGQMNEARAALRSIPDDPSLGASAMVEFAEAAMGLEDAEAAERFALRAVQMNASLARAHELLGGARVVQGKLDLGIQDLELSVQLAPNDPSVHFHLAMAYLAANRRVAARGALERALALAPDFEGARELLLTIGEPH